MLCTAASACARVSTPLKMTPCRPMSRACLTDPRALVRLQAGSARKRATFGATLPFLTAVRLVDHADVEHVQSRDVERGVLHVDVDVIDGGAGQRPRVLEREVAGVDADERFALASFSMTGLRCTGARCAAGPDDNSTAIACDCGNQQQSNRRIDSSQTENHNLRAGRGDRKHPGSGSGDERHVLAALRSGR
jgi:hypothetical protein